MKSRRRVALAPIVTLLLGALVGWILVPASAQAAAADDPFIVTPPSVSGTARWGENLAADTGSWDPADTTVQRQWLRNGVAVPGETGASYRINDVHDLFKVFSVRVQPVGRPDLAVESAPSERSVRATFTNTSRPTVTGTLKHGTTLTAKVGTWSRGALHYKYQWFSGGKPVTGATQFRYTLRSSDVGHTIRVEVTAVRAGFDVVTATSRSTGYVKSAVTVRRTVTYSVSTRGTITQSLSTFKQQAQQTLDDPRGWLANGIRFKQVSSGGSFTLVLSEASKVPSFSSGCSSTYSCRVGRYVIINQDRWRSATPSWNAAGGSLRDYRHMVVNHEVGHWLGRGHASCSSRGALAPVMQQQSKNLQGCRFNAWPKSSELYAPRYGF